MFVFFFHSFFPLFFSLLERHWDCGNIQVKGGTAVPNVIEFATKALQSGEHRTIVWTGYGGGVGKTISCAEIMKRNFPLHQVTRLCYKT